MAEDIEELINESHKLQEGLLDTTMQLDDFVHQLNQKIEQLRAVLPGGDPCHD